MTDDINKLIYDELKIHRVESAERHNIFVEKSDKRFDAVEQEVKDLKSFQDKSKGVMNVANFIGVGGIASVIGAIFLTWKG